MAKARSLVGLDVHATKVVAAVLDSETGELQRFGVGRRVGDVVESETRFRPGQAQGAGPLQGQPRAAAVLSAALDSARRTDYSPTGCRLT